jgi:hypothetical protein
MPLVGEPHPFFGRKPPPGAMDLTLEPGEQKWPLLEERAGFILGNHALSLGYPRIAPFFFLVELRKWIVQHLFESGAIQVLVVSKVHIFLTTSIPSPAKLTFFFIRTLLVASHMVITMGVQYYEGKEHHYIDYPVMDVLQMMGHTC